MKSVIPIVSVTDHCPLSCDYCYVREKNTLVMDFEVLKQIIDLCAAKSSGSMTIIWHGGEPLTAGVEYFEKAFRYCQEIKSTKIIHKIQTSGTILNESWLSLMKEFHVRVGVSLDGPMELHNAHRRFRSGHGSFDTVYANVNTLVANGMTPGFILVVSKEHMGRAAEVFAFFQEHGWDFSISQMSPVTQYGCKEAPTDEEYLGFYSDLLRIYLRQTGKYIQIVPMMHHIISVLSGRSVGLCSNSKSCGLDYLAFAPDGSIYPCNRFVGVDDCLLGHAQAITSLDELREGQQFKGFVSRLDNTIEECTACRHLRYCYGGCPHEEFTRSGQLSSRVHQCAIYRKLFSIIQDELNSLACTDHTLSALLHQVAEARNAEDGETTQ